MLTDFSQDTGDNDTGDSDGISNVTGDGTRVTGIIPVTRKLWLEMIDQSKDHDSVRWKSGY